jgi:amino acid transporter
MFGRLHAQRKSPVTATIVIAILGIVLFVASNYVHSVGALFSDAINALGLQIAIYYSLAGISVVILYRKQLFTSVGNFIFMGLWPLVGSIFMVVMFIKVLPGLNGTTIIVSMGAMALGLIPMFYYWAKGNPYYKRATKLERVAQIQEIEEMEELL